MQIILLTKPWYPEYRNNSLNSSLLQINISFRKWANELNRPIIKEGKVKALVGSPSKKICGQQISTWKNAYLHLLLGKCKLKLQCATIYLLQWLTFFESENIKCWRGCRTSGTLMHCKLESSTRILENCWCLIRSNLYLSAIPLLGICLRI